MQTVISTKNLHIALIGATGRMGVQIQELAHAKGSGENEIRIVPIDKTFLSPTASLENQEILLKIFQNCDVVLDVSVPDVAAYAAPIAATASCPYVTGVTGLTEADKAALEAAASHIPVLVTANFSLGITLLKSLVQEAASRLPNTFDIEIFEMHHRNKRDSPSGTALLLADAAAKGLGMDTTDKQHLLDADRSGLRPEGKIGYGVLRGGSVAGTHTIFFASEGETLELSHRAESRTVFAKGALVAAKWLSKGNQRLIGQYAMEDVLGIVSK